jgi:plastocyanin
VFPCGLEIVRRPISVFGVGLLAFSTISLSLTGCDGSEGEAPGADAEALQALGLSPRSQLHRVTLGGRGADEHAVPTQILASPGDGVEFLTVDHRVHTLAFPLDSLSPEVRLFLEESGQTSSPPLVTRGSRFILNLKNAPPGRYPFISDGHGGKARGLVQVGDPPASDSVRG